MILCQIVRVFSTNIPEMEMKNDNIGINHLPLEVNFILTRKNNGSNKAVAKMANT
jgi:hypothetical protein